MGFGNFVKNAFTPVKLKKRVFDPEKVSIEDIKLPKILNDLDRDVIISMVKDEVVTYKSLGYKDKSLGALDVNVYHSFQIGTILKYLQLGYDLFIPNKKEVFSTFMLKYPYESLQSKVFDIIKEYDKKVSKMASENELISDMRWSPLDINYLLFYLTVYKDVK